MLERLLKLCGPLLNWRRSVSGNKPQFFGVAEFDALESVYVCLKVLHNLRLFDNNINIKTDTATDDYLKRWSAEKEEQWIARKTAQGTYDSAELAMLRATNQILPHERLLIPNYDQIREEIDEVLRDSGSILNRELNFIGGAEQKTAELNQEAQEALLKFKANEREVDRERRQQAQEKERELKYNKKLADWLDREDQKARQRLRQRDSNDLKHPSCLTEQSVTFLINSAHPSQMLRLVSYLPTV